ncbi:hypothetical protein B0H10DRAFT_2439677 [Mycena sp. CBHHK59/15]|nr:hypothetical protein B0H10DRAFT_2439677 [Mycena sp. CBHHK59/15]
MLLISSQETHRLFSPLNRPKFDTNVRHHAMLRKALELYTPEQLAEVFHQDPTRLHVAMGSAFTFSQFGKIKTNFLCNYRLVSHETPPPDVEARDALCKYVDVHDAYFMLHGNDYAIRNASAQSAFQAAEQTWHDWIVPYLAAHGRPGRPDWALQPLPGLRRVHIAPTPCAPAPAPCAATPFPILPTPPPSAPVPVRIDLSHIDDEPARPARKRKFLGIINISDDEEQHAALGPQHYFITTNTEYVPALPSLEVPHMVFLRSNMHYGTDDPALWPQQWTPEYCHMPLIAKKGARPELDVMWWDLAPADFAIGSAVTRGLGRLAPKRLSPFLPPINELIGRYTELWCNSPTLAIPMFGEIIQHITLPTTFAKMVFAVTSLQRAFLELDALYSYMTIYKPRMSNYLAAPTPPALAQSVGSFTTVPRIAQQLFEAGVPFWLVRPIEVFDTENILAVVPLREPRFGLPDDNARGTDAPPVLYTGNSTHKKIVVIQRAAVHTPWYHNPFETADTCARSPSPDPVIPVASGSRSVVPPCLSSRSPPVVCNRPWQSHSKPYSAKPPAKKGPTKTERDKFTILAVEEMPPSIRSVAEALAQVDRSVTPYTADDADKQYVLPEPALLVNTSSDERHRKFLHHWNLLADGFIYMLMERPQPLRPQEWRRVGGLMTMRGPPGSRTHRQSEQLQDCIRPALKASNVSSVKGFPVPAGSLPHFSFHQIREIVWQVAETSFQFEFCSLDKRVSKKNRVNEVKACFAGHMLVGVPLEMSKHGWAATTLEERHRYVERTATLMLDWTTKSTRPNIIRRVAEHLQWSPSDMQALETAVCRYYTQEFWESFGHTAVVPMCLDHDVEKEEGEL